MDETARSHSGGVRAPQLQESDPVLVRVGLDSDLSDDLRRIQKPLFLYPSGLLTTPAGRLTNG